jgi:hypothetical protein
MEGFAVTEICPLTNAQILSITEKWLGVKNEDFLKCLKNVPYFDVANRPLLLTNLLFYYKRYEYLPDQPTQIYSKLVDILLQEWDAEREIHRDSRYSGFDPTKKAEFLSLLAYKLTYPEEKAVFTEKDLIKAYLSICDRFHLPKNEATKVAREIQTHTGIISAGPQDTYEFCHLSLQEYLTAQYIVKSPLETQMTEYLCKYAAPLAVAVALSSTPSKWFGNFILQFRNLNKFNPDELNSFLSRVLVENPSFEESEILGFAIILLYRHYYTNEKVCEYLGRLIQIESVMKSTAKALRWYIPEPGNKKNTSILLKLDSSLQPVYSFTLPAFGALPRKYVKTLKNAVGSSVLFFQKVEDIR